ncbi:MAG: hypothetical protein KDA71_08375 [Planctomycetales bacterium]|nr:hypothetical protein [Planctomycetales bacterium]
MSDVSPRVIVWSCSMAMLAAIVWAGFAVHAVDSQGSRTATAQALDHRLSFTMREAAEPLDQQIAAVRAGESDAINVSEPIDEAKFRELATLPGLRVLQVDRGRVTDAGMVALAKAESLEHLRLRESPIGDEGLRQLAELKNLRVLNLPHAVFTDRGLADIARLPNLELLRFASPLVTDDGLKELAGLRRLRFLHIVAAPITDDGLAHIAALSNLESFYIDHASVTDEGLSRLVKSRPDLHLHVHQHHLDTDPRRHDHAH